jgi:Spy/CpxP family protein refolding chaperone
MKKVLVTIVLVLFAFAGVNAQNRPQRNPEEMAKRQTDAIKEKVKLTDAQYKKVLEINLKSSQEMMEAMKSNERDMSTMMKMNNKKDSLIKLVLTPEQIDLYNEYLKERRSMMRQGGRGPGGNR